jgi:hypothetical protein
MNPMVQILFLTLVLNLIYSSKALSNVEFQEPIASGSDCPTENIVHTISPDSQAVSFLLNGTMLMEHQPGVTQGKIVQKRCVLQIPLAAHPKQQYVILTHDWRLYAGLPEKSKLTVNSRIWLWHERVRPHHKKSIVVNYYKDITKNYFGPQDSDFIFTQGSREPRVTECGKPFNLTIEFKLKLKNNNSTESALVDVDSFDLAQSPTATIVKRDCQ